MVVVRLDRPAYHSTWQQASAKPVAMRVDTAGSERLNGTSFGMSSPALREVRHMAATAVQRCECDAAWSSVRCACLSPGQRHPVVSGMHLRSMGWLSTSGRGCRTTAAYSALLVSHDDIALARAARLIGLGRVDRCGRTSPPTTGVRRRGGPARWMGTEIGRYRLLGCDQELRVVGQPAGASSQFPNSRTMKGLHSAYAGRTLVCWGGGRAKRAPRSRRAGDALGGFVENSEP